MDSTAVPCFPEAVDVLTHPNAELWGTHTRPFPTNQWWTPACLEGGERTIHPLPYQLQLRSDHVAVCCPDFMVAEKYVISIFVDHLRIGCTEKLMGHRLVTYDDMMARFAWKSEAESTAMECPVIQGSPYVTFYYKNTTPSLTSGFAIAADFTGEYTGDVFKVPLNNGQSWMIYASKNITLQFSVNPCTIIATAPFSGVIRVALSPKQPEAAQMLDQCRHVIPTSTKTHLQIDDQKLTYVYEYETESMASKGNDEDLLMMALPHHVTMNVKLALPQSVGWYKTIKGQLHGVRGKTWTMELTIIDVWWDSIQTIDPKHANVVRGALYAEQQMRVHNIDPYACGKRMAAIGRLAVIADELGEECVARNVRERLKTVMEPWLTSCNADALVYDPIWGGVISTEGTKNPNADYGSGMYNDHHFQYGYFIYAAAAIGRRDQEWLQAKITPLMNLIRDYANPSNSDPYYPRLRHFDAYACHSWASGLFTFPDGKNQESSSEAVNAYYAIALLGQVLNRPDWMLHGQGLFQLEIHSTKTYWHIIDDPSPIYPSPFSHNGTVGIVWGGKVDYSTWFGANLEYIHCIQMIPFLPVSELLFSKEWIAKVLEKIGHLKDDGNVEIGWRGFIWMALAVVDKEAAWKGFVCLDGYPDLGNSFTNALYWIATRP